MMTTDQKFRIAIEEAIKNAPNVEVANTLRDLLQEVE